MQQMKNLLNSKQKKQKEFNLFEKFDFELIAWHFIFFGTMLAVAILDNRIIETAVLFCCVHLIRYAFPKTYHHKTFWGCLAVSCVVIWLVIPRVLPIQYSIFSSLAVGFLVGWYAYFYQNQKDKYIDTIVELEKVITELKYKQVQKRSVEGMSREQLMEYCKELGFSSEHIKVAVAFICDKLVGQSLYKAVGYSRIQTIRIREKIKQALEI